MKKLIGFVIVICFGIFTACDNNVPSTVHNSIADASGPSTWLCFESSVKFGSKSYLTYIYRLSADTTQYLISNLQNISDKAEGDVKAKLTGATLTFSPNQPITNGNTTFIVTSGTGVVSNSFNKIDLVYYIFDGTNDVQVKATFTR